MMLARLMPQSPFWRFAVVLLWIVSAIAGVLSTSRYEDLCDLLLKVKNALSDLEPIFVGLGTLAIAAFTWRLWAATSGLWHHARAVERAYVKMSHLPPGVTFNESGKATVTIQVINRGRTPAYVTDVRLSPIVLLKTESLAARPRYKAPDGQSAQAFLVASDHIFIGMEFTVQDWAAIKTGSKTLYFVGYVDYVDAFKGRHRGGYARVYNRHEQTNNLVFVTSSAYNYDIPRSEGVGIDWGGDYA
jgi:4-amino-4-deoxy-L-arabinose transferase-like glycosyltransferase